MQNLKLSLIIFSILVLFSSIFISSLNLTYSAYIKAPPSTLGPRVNDPDLYVEKINDKPLDKPTSMSFLGENDILVTEKETGKVIRITDGQVQDSEPVLDVDVAASIERGMLGITISNQNVDNKTYVFLFYTESGGGEDGDDYSDDVDPEGNRLYRYDLVDGKLINPILLLDLPADPENNRGEHNGGKVIIGPDNNIYTVIGEVGAHRTQAQNVEDGPEADGTGGVLRITQEGKPIVDDPIFGEDSPLNLYYAIGIRNSFGIDFDPLTGTLWGTENGPTMGDEVNLIEPGFNSGWVQIQGKVTSNLRETGAIETDLVHLGKSKYRDPEFTWYIPIGVTDAKFLSSDKLGKQYENDLFVGDINNGFIYRFTLNSERTGLEFSNSSYSGNLQELADREVNKPIEVTPIVFGQGFGGITDIEVGPDGYIYILSFFGDIYKILPKTADTISSQQLPADESPTSTTSLSDSVLTQIVGVEGDSSYNPNPIIIEEGQTILWVNGDAISHTVTSGLDNDDDAGELFDSDAILPGHSYSHEFEDAGVYEYYCFYHPSMIGEVIVE